MKKKKERKKRLSLIKIILPVCILPFCIGLAKALVEQLARVDKLSPQQFYFMLGFTSYLLLQVIFFKPIRTYIFGHELTHALWSMLFGGRVKEFSVGKNGGSVLLTKTNFVVTLAPYFFPLYSVLVIVLYYTIGFFTGLEPYVSYMVYLLGFTFSFHIALTMNSLTGKQPDLIKTGVFFSLSVIFFINIIVVALVMKLVSPGSIYLFGFLKRGFGIGIFIYSWTGTYMASVIDKMTG
ncbi:MAG: hypothetical protein ABH868_02870 [bacterium]